MTALKTVSARIRGSTTELEELGEETEGLADGLSKYRDELQALTGFDIMVDDNTYKNIYEIFDGISQVWDDLSDTAQSRVSEILGGTRQLQVISSIMNNWDDAAEAYADAMDSAGVATEANEIVMETTEKHVEQLKASFQELAVDIFDSDMMKAFVDVAKAALDIIDALIDQFGTLGTVIGTVTIGKFTKDFVHAMRDIGNATQATTAFSTALATTSTASQASSGALSSLWGVLQAHPILGVTAAVTVLGMAFNNVESQYTSAAKAAQEANSAYEESESQLESLNDEYESVQSQINELNQLKTDNAITLAQETELTNLQAQSEELERQIALQESLNDLRKDEAERTAQEALETEKTLTEQLQDEYGTILGTIAGMISKVTASTPQYGNKYIGYESALDYQQRDTTLPSLLQTELNNLEIYKAALDDVHEELNKDPTNKFLLNQQDELNDYITTSEQNIIDYSDEISGYLSYVTDPEQYEELSNLLEDAATINLDEFEKQSRKIEEYFSADWRQDWADALTEAAEDGKDFDKVVEDLGIDVSKIGDNVTTQSLEEYFRKTVEDANDMESEVIEAFSHIYDQLDGMSGQAQTTMQSGLDETYQSLLHWWDSLTDNEKERAYNIIVNAEVSELNVEDLQKRLYGVDFTVDLSNIENSFGNTVTQIDECIEAYDNYQRALASGSETDIDDAFDQISEAASNAGISVDNFLNAFENCNVDTMEKNAIFEWFNALEPEDKELVYKISISSDQTSLWTLKQWKQNLNDLKLAGETSAESLQDFYAVMKSDADDSFSSQIDSYISTIDTLESALSSVNLGTMTESDKIDLAMNFPELSSYTGDTDTLRNAIQDLIDTTNEGINEYLAEQIEELGGESTTAGQKMLEFQSILEGLYSTATSFDIDAETDKFKNLYNAMGESVESTGLTTDSIKNIEAMYSDLDGYDPEMLFEKTEHGIHLNTTALRALESEYESTKKLGMAEDLQDLKEKYNEAAEAVDGLDVGSQEYYDVLNAKGLSTPDAILDQIRDVQTLQSQYEGLTSSYNKWIQAQSGGEEGDMYDNITGSLERIKELYDEGLVGTNEFRSAVQLMTDEDLSSASADEIVAVYEDGYAAMQRYFTESNDGCVQFLEDIRDINTEWADIVDGNWVVDFGIGNDAEIAQALSDMYDLQISTEEVQIIMRKLSDYGFDVKLDSAYTSIDELKSKIEDSEAALLELGADPVNINVNCDLSEIDDEIAHANSEIEVINNSDIDPDVKTAKLEDANNKLDALISRKLEAEEPAFMQLSSTDVDNTLSSTLTLVQQYQQAVQERETLELKCDTKGVEKAQEKVDSLAQDLVDLYETDEGKEIMLKAGFEIDEASELSIREQIEQSISLNQLDFGVLTLNPKVEVDSSSMEQQVEQEVEQGLQSVVDNISGPTLTVPIQTDDSELQRGMSSASGEKSSAQIDITADTSQAEETVNAFIDSIADEIVPITITADVTEAEETLNGLKDSISIDPTTLSVIAETEGTDEVNDLKDAILSLEDRTLNETAEVFGTEAVKSLYEAIESLTDKTVTATAKVVGLETVRTLKNTIDSLKDKTVTTTNVTKTTSGTSSVNGTAQVTGTAKDAGDIGARRNETALVGELGPELIVRDGQYFTVGDNGAEFADIKANDIIFNADQTRQLLEHGRIISGRRRGTSMAEGTAYSSTRPGKFYGGSSSNSDNNNNNDSGGNSSGNTGNNSNKTKSSSSDTDTQTKTALEKFQEWFSQLFDWIEIQLERQTDKINRYIARAETALDAGNYRASARNYRQAISTTADQSSTERRASSKYLAQADKVLDKARSTGTINAKQRKEIEQGVAGGTLDITKYSDEVQEVISAYQEWYDKSVECSDAIQTLHQNIRTYVQDLKDLRDAQRDTTIESLNTFTEIGTSTNAYTARTQNQQLNYTNSQLESQNKAYRKETKRVSSDTNKLASTASESVSNALGSAKSSSYTKALKDAQKSINAGKKVSSSTLKTIKAKNRSVYENLYAYNLSLDNLETARLEEVTNYAATSAQRYSNTLETYSNTQAEYSNNVSLYEQQSANATSAASKNSYLDQAATEYAKISSSANDAVTDITKEANHKAKKIGEWAGTTSAYNSANAKTQKAVQKCINKAKSAAASGKAIDSSVISELAEYESEGYVTRRFMQECLDYNNAIETKQQAEDAAAIAKEEEKAYLASLGTERVQNVQQEYQNKETTNQNRTSLLEAQQNTRNTRGLSTTKEQYQELIDQSKELQGIYQDERDAIAQTVQENLDNGYWTKSSQEYLDAIAAMDELDISIQNCTTDQEEYNNALAQLPYNALEAELELLDAIAALNKSQASLISARGEDLSEQDYLQQIEDNNKIIDKTNEELQQAYQDMLQAEADPEGVYGGKTLAEWQAYCAELKTTINDTEADNEALKDSLRDDVYWRDFERAHDACQRFEDVLSGVMDLISNDMLYDSEGKLTEFGVAQVANLVSEYENAQEEVENYTNDLENLYKLYDEGWYTLDEFEEKQNELQTSLLDSASAMKSAMDEIVNMYKDMAQSELDALFDLIDARNKALSAKKSYYDYDKSISSKTGDIASLQAQIAALEGVNLICPTYLNCWKALIAI